MRDFYTGEGNKEVIVKILDGIFKFLNKDEKEDINTISKDDIIHPSENTKYNYYYGYTNFRFISLSDEEYISPSSGWDVKPVKR